MVLIANVFSINSLDKAFFFLVLTPVNAAPHLVKKRIFLA